MYSLIIKNWRGVSNIYKLLKHIQFTFESEGNHKLSLKLSQSYRSIQNILLRQSLKKELNVVLPKRGQNQLNPSQPFDPKWLETQDLPWHKTFVDIFRYDMMALHCMWNYQSIR